MYSKTKPALILQRFGNYLLCPELISKNPLLVDIGFCCGDFTVPFLVKYKGNAIGYEPIRQNITTGRERATDAGVSERLTVHNVAVNTKIGYRKLFYYPGHVESHSFFNTCAYENCEIFSVPTVPFSALLAPFVHTIDVLKVNAEGVETELLTTVFEDVWYKAIQIILAPHTKISETLEADITAYFTTLGFKVIKYPKIRAPQENLFWIGRGDFCENRTVSICDYANV